MAELGGSDVEDEDEDDAWLPPCEWGSASQLLDDIRYAAGRPRHYAHTVASRAAPANHHGCWCRPPPPGLASP